MEFVEFRAMGSACRIVVDGGPSGIAGRARDMVDRLEHTWTRFDASSEISAANANAGNFQLVSPETYALIDHAVVAQRETGGRFNALMLKQLVAHGYSATWSTGPSSPSSIGITPATSDQIALLPEINGVSIPFGSAFDPGGIGKGLCADLVTDYLVDNGVTCSSVELGGDLRVSGTPWYGPSWRIGVGDPFTPDDEIGAFTPVDGAVATSSRLKKSWTSGTQKYHHLLDPRTGQPAHTDLVSVSCCAATAWWAEVVAKVVLISGAADARGLFAEFGVHGIAVTEAGNVIRSDANEVMAPTRTATIEEVLT